MQTPRGSCFSERQKSICPLPKSMAESISKNDERAEWSLVARSMKAAAEAPQLRKRASSATTIGAEPLAAAAMGGVLSSPHCPMSLLSQQCLLVYVWWPMEQFISMHGTTAPLGAARIIETPG